MRDREIMRVRKRYRCEKRITCSYQGATSEQLSNNPFVYPVNSMKSIVKWRKRKKMKDVHLGRRWERHPEGHTTQYPQPSRTERRWMPASAKK